MKDIFTYLNDNGDSLTLSAANGYRIASITGTSGISVNANQAQGIGQIGTTVQSRVVQSVPMTITGYIFGTRAQIEASAERLFQVVLPDIGARLYHNGTYYRIVTPTATPVVDNALRFPGFQFSLLAPYPYWMLDQATKTILTGVLPRFKFHGDLAAGRLLAGLMCEAAPGFDAVFTANTLHIMAWPQVEALFTGLPTLLRATLPADAAAMLGPALASILIYLLMAGILFFKPQGLFPARA